MFTAKEARKEVAKVLLRAKEEMAEKSKKHAAGTTTWVEDVIKGACEEGLSSTTIQRRVFELGYIDPDNPQNIGFALDCFDEVSAALIKAGYEVQEVQSGESSARQRQVHISWKE